MPFKHSHFLSPIVIRLCLAAAAVPAAVADWSICPSNCGWTFIKNRIVTVDNDTWVQGPML